MTDVFISYSRKDKDFVHKLDEALKKLNRDVWIDWEDIPPTADWKSEIRSGIEAANTFLCVLSPDWLSSKVCAEEFNYAVEYKKKLVPIVYREVPPDQTHPLLASHNWLFFREADPFDQAFQRLINALDDDLDYIREHTRFLIRAREWQTNNQNPSFLLRGDELAAAQRWYIYSTDKKPEAADLHIKYIEASEKAEADRRAHDEQIARRVQNFGRAAVILAIVGTLALIAMIVSIIQAQQAITQVVHAGETLTPIPATLEFARGQAHLSSIRMTVAAQTLFPIPDTLTPARQTLVAGNGLVATAQTQVAEVQQQLTNIAPAQTQVARVGETLTPIAATFIAGQHNVATAQMQSIYAARTLTPIPPTLTALANDVLQQRSLAASLRWVTFANDILQQNGNTETATLLGIQALKTAYSIQADTVLEQAVSRLYTLQTLTGFTQPIKNLVFAPDGKTFVTTGSTDSSKPNAIEVRDALTGELIKQLVKDKLPVNAIAYSADSKYILSGGGDLTLRLWDAALGVEVRNYAVDAPKGAFITSVAISNDNKFLLAGTSTGPIHVFQFKGESIQILGDRTQLFGYAVNSAIFSSDGKLVLEASADKAVRLWVISTGRILRQFSGHIDAVNTAVFSKGGNYILTASNDQTIRLWDANTATQIRVYPGHRGEVTSASFSPDGRTILSSSADKTARVWDQASGEVLRVYSGHTDTVTTASFAPDNESIITASADKTIRVWTWSNSSNSPLRSYSNIPGFIKKAVLSPDARVVATHALDGQIRLWNAYSGLLMQTISTRFASDVTFTFSPDSSKIFIASNAGEPGAWEVATGKELRDFNRGFRFQALGAADVAFTRDGKRLAIVGNDNRARLWNMEKFFQIRVLNGTATHIAITPDSKTVVTVGDRIHIFDAETGNELRSLEFPYEVQHIEFTRSGALLALVVQEENAIPYQPILLDLQTGKSIKDFKELNGQLRFSPDGSRMLIYTVNGVLTFDAATNTQLRLIAGKFASVQFSAEGKEVITLTTNGIIGHWDADYNDLILTACTRIGHDLEPTDRTAYAIVGDKPICGS